MDAFKGFPCWMHSREMVSITAELFSIEIIQDIELICHKIWIINYSTIRKTRNVAAVLIKNSHEPSSTIVLGNGMKILALVGTKNARFEPSSNCQVLNTQAGPCIKIHGKGSFVLAVQSKISDRSFLGPSVGQSRCFNT